MSVDSLNFGEVSATESVKTEASLYPHRLEASAILFPSLLVLLLFGGVILFLKRDEEKSLSKRFSLADLSVSAKAAITLTLVSFGLVHIFSVLTVFLKTHVAFESTQAYFFYMPIHQLAALSHAHFFGHGVMYILTAVAFLFTSLPERVKRFVVLLAPSGAILDTMSWWGIKLISSKFEILSFIAGSLLSLGFIVMAVVIFVQLWFHHSQKKD